MILVKILKTMCSIGSVKMDQNINQSRRIFPRNRMEHWHKITVWLVLYDIFAVNLSHGLALWLRFDCRVSMIPNQYLWAFIKFAPIYTIISIGIFWFARLYKSIWRFASYSELILTACASVATFVVQMLGITFFFQRMPVSYYFIGAVIQFVMVLAARFSYRFLLLERNRWKRGNIAKKPEVRIMMIGAGAAGQMIMRDVHKMTDRNERVQCIIDDNPNKWNRYIESVPIVGGREDILVNVKKYKIDKIYFAISNCTPEDKREILNICNEAECEVKILPSMQQFITGDMAVGAMKDVSVEDLLGRDPIKTNLTEVFRYVSGKVIMVTGGGGSIGSELCRQIAAHAPKHLIIFDVYENNAYDIEQELRRKYPGVKLTVLIGSVRDSRRINSVFQTYKPQIVYHAAAHKHVPLMETSPCEAIKNNAIGTYKTAYAALMNGCEKFVLISTDKAVNPTNIMGASKRLCEMVIQSFDKAVKDGTVDQLPLLFAHQEDEDGSMRNMHKNVEAFKTEYVAVRFGNVLGSNGSVIPLFKKQIAAGGPVTVTHPDIIRYFMTIPEAVSLVLQAGTYAKGGEIFVLDMGEPVKIDTLARNLIKLSGFKPDVDIPVLYTGLRPGEKLFEEKLMEEEGLKTTPNKLIHIGSPIPFDTEKFLSQMELLMKAAYENQENIRDLVESIVTTYHPVG